jgi:transglutaminase-like putative cysteine protease
MHSWPFDSLALICVRKSASASAAGASADASHAWCSAWCPGAGWADFDPTNNCVPEDGHITVAWGRDYCDVSPIHGVLLGGAKHTLHVGVDVMPIQ